MSFCFARDAAVYRSCIVLCSAKSPKKIATIVCDSDPWNLWIVEMVPHSRVLNIFWMLAGLSHDCSKYLSLKQTTKGYTEMIVPSEPFATMSCKLVSDRASYDIVRKKFEHQFFVRDQQETTCLQTIRSTTNHTHHRPKTIDHRDRRNTLNIHQRHTPVHRLCCCLIGICIKGWGYIPILDPIRLNSSVSYSYMAKSIGHVNIH